MAIASADSELSQKELDWFVEEQPLVGVPSDFIEENILKFDSKNADIEQLLGGIHDDFPINFRRFLSFQLRYALGLITTYPQAPILGLYLRSPPTWAGLGGIFF